MTITTKEIDSIAELLTKFRAEIAEREKQESIKRNYKHVVDGCGRTYSITSFNDEGQKKFITQGRAFYTLEEAELFRDKERLIAKIKQEYTAGNYQIIWIRALGALKAEPSTNWVYLCCGMPKLTEKDANACIKKYSDEIMRVLEVV